MEMPPGFRVIKNKQPTWNHACLWVDWNNTKFHGKRKIKYFLYYIAKHLIVINWKFWTLQDRETLCLFHLHPGTMKHMKPSERTFSSTRKIGVLLFLAMCWTICESVCWGLQNFIEKFYLIWTLQTFQKSGETYKSRKNKKPHIDREHYVIWLRLRLFYFYYFVLRHLQACFITRSTKDALLRNFVLFISLIKHR